jgi:hypothetical protein
MMFWLVQRKQTALALSDIGQLVACVVRAEKDTEAVSAIQFLPGIDDIANYEARPLEDAKASGTVVLASHTCNTDALAELQAKYAKLQERVKHARKVTHESEAPDAE